MNTRSNRTVRAAASVTCLVAVILLIMAASPAILSAARTKAANQSVAKNIIVMIADGWDYNHVDASSYYQYGAAARQVYNRFPFRYAMSTYAAFFDFQACHEWGYDPVAAWSDFGYVHDCWTDSAAAATAMSTGVKTRWAAIGVDLDNQPLPHVLEFAESEATLEEMTRAALNVLDDDPDGLFLMIEGGAVDWASHSNQSGRMIEEQIGFDYAVEAVVEWVKTNSNWGETLLIVTGDHETGYLTGPGSDPGWTPIVNNGAGNLPGMEWHSADHTNRLIPFFAKGKAARRFRSHVDGKDPIHGRYLDNTDLAEVIFWAMTPRQRTR